MSKIDDLRAELGLKYGRLFTTPEGKELLAYLSRQFFEGELLGATPEETAFNLGAREVVRAMRDLAALLAKQERPDGR